MRFWEFNSQFCWYQLVATISVAWSWRTDLNPRPDAYKTSALPTELHQHIWSARSTLRKVSWPKTGTVPAAPSLQMATHFDIGNDLTRLEDSIRFELMMPVKHTGFQDLRNKPNSANYPFFYWFTKLANCFANSRYMSVLLTFFTNFTLYKLTQHIPCIFLPL